MRQRTPGDGTPTPLTFVTSLKARYAAEVTGYAGRGRYRPVRHVMAEQMLSAYVASPPPLARPYIRKSFIPSE